MNFPLEYKQTYWKLLEHLQHHHASRPFNLLHVLEELSIDPKALSTRLLLQQIYSRHLVAPVMEEPGWPKHIVYLTHEGWEKAPALVHA